MLVQPVPSPSSRRERPARVDSRRTRYGFTLIELLVVVSIIAVLIGILMPSLRRARKQSRATVCMSQLRSIGQGLGMYAMDNNDALLPSRMPDMGDGVNWRMYVAGGLKYRPTFLATVSQYVGVPAFDDPQAVKTSTDMYGEEGDRQNFASDVYVCPAVAHWTDERNGAYGYNYQFLGNSRLVVGGDEDDFKNWPSRFTEVSSPGGCVAVADCMGTAASFAAKQRYVNNSRDADRYGNEGFNLDPPRVDGVNGEMANLDKTPQSRTAADPRHLDRTSVLWLDAHASLETSENLGYDVDDQGIVTFEGNNRKFHIDGKDEAWVQQ